MTSAPEPHHDRVGECTRALVAAPRVGRLMPLACLLLFLAGLPDAMIVPVLRQLTVQRYGMSVASAHLFMAVNLLGALAIAALAGPLRRRCSDRTLVGIAALANAALLALLAQPIGAGMSLFLRSLEGAADLLVYAVLFDMVAKAGPRERRGRRMGLAATVMMIGLASGMAIGGVIGRIEATLTLTAGAAACAVLGLGALGLPRGIGTGVEAVAAISHRGQRPRPQRAVKASFLMMFADRSASAVFVATVPLFLTSVLGLDPARVGGLIGLAMLMTALSAWPFGRLVDSVGPLPVRWVCTGIYATGLALIPVSVNAGLWPGLLNMCFLGLGGGGLFASSLYLASRGRHGATAMGAYYAAGNIGFFVGPITAGTLLVMLGGPQPPASSYQIVLMGFALAHATLSATACIFAARDDRMPASTGIDEEFVLAGGVVSSRAA